MSRIKEKITKEQDRFKREARNQTITMMITSFSFVAGLAWNEAIKSSIEHFYPAGGGGMFAKVFYAFFVTGIVVFVSYILTRMKHPEHKEENPKSEAEKTPH